MTAKSQLSSANLEAWLRLGGYVVVQRMSIFFSTMAESWSLVAREALQWAASGKAAGVGELVIGAEREGDAPGVGGRNGMCGGGSGGRDGRRSEGHAWPGGGGR